MLCSTDSGDSLVIATVIGETFPSLEIFTGDLINVGADKQSHCKSSALLASAECGKNQSQKF